MNLPQLMTVFLFSTVVTTLGGILYISTKVVTHAIIHTDSAMIRLVRILLGPTIWLSIGSSSGGPTTIGSSLGSTSGTFSLDNNEET